MTFEHPWLLALPLLYLLARALVRPRPLAAPFPSAAFLSALPRTLKVRTCEPTLLLLSIITVAALSGAAARPQRVTVLETPRKARNIMLVVDASNSMSAEDFPTSFGHASRMEGVKAAVSEYVRGRRGDRVGLIVFGNTAYLQCPLTSDTSLVDQLVQGLYPRMAGDGTAIGDGLGLALKRLRGVPGESKAIILITDGVNTAGQVGPLKAAEVAKELGVQIHTIGVGSGTATMPGAFLGGAIGAPPGMLAEFDEKTLRQMAQLTGGAYFNASSLEGFQEVYRKLEKLQETEQDQPDRRLVEELYPYLVLVALAAYLLGALLKSTLFLRIP